MVSDGCDNPNINLYYVQPPSATNLPSPDDLMTLYPYRMWAEEMFGDLKGNGFDLEDAHLRHTDKLKRLSFAVSLFYIRLVALGVELTKLGHVHEVDRSDRRDLSFFVVGLTFLSVRVCGELRRGVNSLDTTQSLVGKRLVMKEPLCRAVEIPFHGLAG